MTRRRKDPLRALTPAEKRDLESISCARSAPADAVTRAKVLLNVAAGMNYQDAAHAAGRKHGDAVSALVSPLQSKRSGCAGSASRRWRFSAARGVRSESTNPEQVSASARSQSGWNDDMVADNVAASASSSGGWLIRGEHLHHSEGSA
jgi:hypothetical protein